MIQINLVPDVKQELLRAQTQRNFIISIAVLLSIGAGIVILLVAGYVYGAQTLLMATSNKSIDTEYAKLSAVKDLDKMLTIQNQLGQVSSLNKDNNPVHNCVFSATRTFSLEKLLFTKTPPATTQQSLHYP
jgi:hypothetical protein